MQKKPILILQSTSVAQPGAILSVLRRLGIPWHIVSAADRHQPPACIRDWSGLVLLGGALSANDDTPWVNAVLHLTRQALAADVPVMGHCLGAQLLSKAAGAVVTKSPYTEIGWHELSVVDAFQSAEWFGGQSNPFSVFQWHSEQFSLPSEAHLLLSSEACAHQAYVLAGKHIAMQFHLEMTPAMIMAFIKNSGHRIAEELGRGNAFIHTEEQIMAGVPQYIPAMQTMLNVLYARWARSLQY